jgi:hypothetical protein
VRQLFRQCGILNTSKPYRPPRPVTGWLYFFTFFTKECDALWAEKSVPLREQGVVIKKIRMRLFITVQTSDLTGPYRDQI